MAKINIEVDTSEKTVSLKVDDKKVDNVHDIHVFTETSGFFGVDIAQVQDLGDLKQITRLVASKNKVEELISKSSDLDNKKIEYVGENDGLHQFKIIDDDHELSKLVAGSLGSKYYA